MTLPLDMLAFAGTCALALLYLLGIEVVKHYRGY